MRGRPVERLSSEILVIGSGAGGAIMAATLAEAGRDVLVLEEGPSVDTSRMATHTPEAMLTLYRNAGLTPIHGRQSIAFVEGCCVGGSTEINSTFWHRPPSSSVARWSGVYRVRELSERALEEAFGHLEADLRIATAGDRQLPPSSQVFKRGLERMGQPVFEAPRAQRGDLAASQFAPGARSSMSQTYLPRATRAGARLLARSRVVRIRYRGGRVRRASVVRTEEDGRRRLSVDAEHVFVCGGAIQTPALLRRSGIRHRVGNALRIQPMLKVVADFDEVLDSHRGVIPAYQMRDASEGFILGGAVFTPGFLGLALASRWPANQPALSDWRRMAIYYTSCRGSGRGTVRAFPGTGEAFVRYSVSREDQWNLSRGLARLCEVLFEGGARRIYPGVEDCPTLESRDDLRVLTEQAIPVTKMALSTVHVSSSCPMGENEGICPADSFGRVRGFENLYLADASIIPDAPGVNPQGTVMALALRNARRFLADRASSG